MACRRTFAALLGVIACVGLAAPLPIHGGARQERRECRQHCDAAIAACIQYKTAPLLAAAVEGRRLRRKAKRIRRLCTKRALRRCRSAGPAACEQPLFCVCEG
jgi:hypothetical protein